MLTNNLNGTLSYVCPDCANAVELDVELTCKFDNVKGMGMSEYGGFPKHQINWNHMLFVECPLCGTGTPMIQIDSKLVPLIQKLWRNGIDTYMCCQGHYGTFYTFSNIDSEFDVYSPYPYIDFEFEDDLFDLMVELRDRLNVSGLSIQIDKHVAYEYVSDIGRDIVRISSYIPEELDHADPIMTKGRFTELEFNSRCDTVISHLDQFVDALIERL